MMNACVSTTQALVTAHKGKNIFKNDSRFSEWIFRCTTVVTDTLHHDVFQCSHEYLLKKQIKRSNIPRNFNPSMKKLQENLLYIEKLSVRIKETGLPKVDDCSEPKEIQDGRNAAKTMELELSDIKQEMLLREQFWYNFF